MAKFPMVLLQRKLTGWKLALDRNWDKGRKGLIKNVGPGIKKQDGIFLWFTSPFFLFFSTT